MQPTHLPAGLYERNKQLYLDYVSYHEELTKEINTKLINLSSEQEVYLFGAHVFSQYLIGFELNTSRIKYTLDNDPNKQGRRLYGTPLSVEAPGIIKDAANPVVILRTGALLSG